MIFTYYHVLFFLFGLIIGSFLNCIIYRLEKKEGLWGRSYCPHCKHTLSWQDLVPIFSFLFLKGKCRYCYKKISWQYPLVEISTALVFLLIFLAALDLAQPNNFINLLFLFYVAASIIVIFVYDLKHYIIPDKILFPAISIAFLYRIIFNFLDFYIFIIAALIASTFFLVIFLVSKGKWIGFGDVKLAILLGLILGFPNVLVGLFLAFLFGAIIGLWLIIFKNIGLKSEIPFAPFLIGGTFMAMIFGEKIIAWYINILLV